MQIFISMNQCLSMRHVMFDNKQMSINTALLI